MADVFSEVERGHAEDERIMAGLQQLDQHLEDLVVLLVEPVGILAPELFRTVNWKKAATMSWSDKTSRGQCQHHQHRRW